MSVRTGDESPRQPRGRGLVVVLLVLAVAAAGGLALAVRAKSKSDKLAPIAESACVRLDGAIVLQVGTILGGAIDDAKVAGYTPVELGDAMRAKCPATMAAVEAVGTKQNEDDQLASKVTLHLEQCGSEKVTGTVVNNSSATVDVFIAITFDDSSGVQVGDSIASVDGLTPGKTAKWEAYVFDKSYAKCRAEVSSVYRS